MKSIQNAELNELVTASENKKGKLNMPISGA